MDILSVNGHWRDANATRTPAPLRAAGELLRRQLPRLLQSRHLGTAAGIHGQDAHATKELLHPLPGGE